jgi:hypothetical protein
VVVVVVMVDLLVSSKSKFPMGPKLNLPRFFLGKQKVEQRGGRPFL